MFQVPLNPSTHRIEVQNRAPAIQVRKGTPFRSCSKSRKFDVKTVMPKVNVLSASKIRFFDQKQLIFLKKNYFFLKTKFLNKNRENFRKFCKFRKF